METPAKKGFFNALTGTLFGRGTSGSSETSSISAPTRKADDDSSALTPRVVHSLDSLATRASDAQLKARKISTPRKLIHRDTHRENDGKEAASSIRKPSIFATSTPATATRRMPGDDPYKSAPDLSKRVSSFSKPVHNLSMIAATNSLRASTNFSTTASAPNNIFRASAAARPTPSIFAPRASIGNTRQSIGPCTSGHANRGAVTEIKDRLASHTSSHDLFSQRIPSPPKNLTGEYLAKQVPANHERPGSIYADEFLTDYCPPGFNDLQRRQFFCILDLRRLKYAADEIFLKKDWRVNISNFCKEFEKSRGLILLRYGLYEFKTVRVSASMRREWAEENGIADPDDESQELRSSHGVAGSKRKADEELSREDVSAAPSASPNKRARPAARTTFVETNVTSSNKNKRKADPSEAEASQPSKLLKSIASPPKAPSSATKSLFESVANSGTPSKASSIFSGPANARKAPNGTGCSIFESAHSGSNFNNIFGHLSGSGKGSEKDGAGEDNTDASGSEEDEEPHSEVRGGSPNGAQSAAASGEVATPQPGLLIPDNAAKPFSSSSTEGVDGAGGRSLFDRMTFGNDGKPVRNTPGPEKVNISASNAPSSPVKSFAPAATPAPVADQTWNTSTPINFAPAPSQETTTPNPAPAENMFGAFAQPMPPEKSTAPASESPKSSVGGSIFGARPSFSTSNMFSFGKPTENAANAFASSTGLFGRAGQTNPDSKNTAAEMKTTSPQMEATLTFFKSSTPGSSTPSSFGAKPATEPNTAPTPALQPCSLLGNTSKAGSDASMTPLFGAPKSTEAPVEPAKSTPMFCFGVMDATKPAPTSNMFGLTTMSKRSLDETEEPAVKRPANNLFGMPADKSAASTSEGPKAKKPSFGTTNGVSGSSLFGNAASTPATAPGSTASTGFMFGASAPASGDVARTAAQPALNLFRNSKTETAEVATAKPANNLFGDIGNVSTPTDAKPLFGQTEPAKPAFTFSATQPSSASAPLFPQAASSTPAPSIFANAAPAKSVAESIFKVDTGSFGASPAGSASFTFGAGASTPQTPAQPSTSFTFGASSGSHFNNPFATNAGANSTPSFDFAASSSQPSSSFVFGSNTNTAPPAISFSAGSAAPELPANPAENNIFAFNGLAPGGGTSTGTNTPFTTIGGASSLATTPVAGTPEPGAGGAEDGQGQQTDGDEAPQAQITLTEGGPGEEEEVAVYRIKCKVLKFIKTDGGSASKESNKSPWKTEGVGVLRLLKHNDTGAVRVLVRAEPRGTVVLNRLLLPSETYKADVKYLKVITGSDDGRLETWLLQVKTAEGAKEMAAAFEEYKTANDKKSRGVGKEKAGDVSDDKGQNQEKKV